MSTDAEQRKDDLTALAALLDTHGPDPRHWPAGRAAWAEALTTRDPEARAMRDAALAAEAALLAPRRQDLDAAGAAERVLAGIAAQASPAPPRGRTWQTIAASLLVSGAMAGAGAFAFLIGYEQGAADAADLIFASPFADLPDGMEGLLGDAL